MGGWRLSAAKPQSRRSWTTPTPCPSHPAGAGQWAGPGSDLDLLVRFHRTPGLIRFIELENYLSDLLGVRVDLVMAEALKPNIGQRVLAEVEPI